MCFCFVNMCMNAHSCLTLCNPKTVDHQAPLSMDFSRQEYWIGLLFPSPGNIPDPGIEPTSLEPPELAGGFFTTGATREAYLIISLDLLICLMCCSYFFVGFFFSLTLFKYFFSICSTWLSVHFH